MKVKLSNIRVIAARRKFMNPLSKEEFKSLSEQINNEGGINTPLDVDQDMGLLDGHNRHTILKKMGVEEVEVKVHNFAGKNYEPQAELFMIERGIGRRNLTKVEFDKFVRLMYEKLKGKKGAPKGNKNQKGESNGPDGAKEKVAKKLGITPGQVKTALTKTKADGTPKDKKPNSILDEGYKELARAMTVIRFRWATIEEEELREWVVTKLEQIVAEAKEGKVKQMTPTEILNSN